MRAAPITEVKSANVNTANAPTKPALFDAHLHIIDPAYPLQANQGYLPDPYRVDDYLGATRELGVVAGAVVSGSFQGFDQSHLLAALARLGPRFVGVTQLPASASDAELDRLAAAGVRGLRFNLRRGGSEEIGQLVAFAGRVFDRVGWHVELYADAAELTPLLPTLRTLPAVSIDHLGLSAAGLPTLLKLVDLGLRVKACGFGRVDFDLADALHRIHAANPQALMFGSDLPSTRAPRAFRNEDLALLSEAVGADGARAVLWDNAAAFYRLSVC